MRTINKAHNTGIASISEICVCFDITRDAYYKYTKRFHSKQLKNDIVLKLVKHERKNQPRIGTRKLHKTLETELKQNNIKLGRDSLFDVLRDNNMLVKRKKATFKTTNSYHRFHKYNNLIKDLDINRPNQVWVADITYIRMVNGFAYLAIITDLFSRKIVGYDISNSLELSGCLMALKNALKTTKSCKGLIHHSDRGIQYCSNEYTQKLIKKGINISMTEENHCYENAVAERVNGILKDEFYLDQTFFNLKSAELATKNAINIYNNKRLHVSLQYKTPSAVFNAA